MKRHLTLYLAAALVAASPVSPAQASVHRSVHCAIDATHQPGAEDLIRCAVRRWQNRFGPSVIPGGAPKAIAVERCESTGNRTARNGRFGGYYQIGDPEWGGWEPSWFWRFHPQADPFPGGGSPGASTSCARCRASHGW